MYMKLNVRNVCQYMHVKTIFFDQIHLLWHPIDMSHSSSVEQTHSC